MGVEGVGCGGGKDMARFILYFEDRGTEFSNMDCKRSREDRNNNKTVVIKDRKSDV